MAYASITYTSASGTTFALTNSSGDPIEYLRQNDISVTVNGVLKTLTTDYTFNTAGTAIVLNTAVSGATVVIARTTDIADATVSFTAGSTLTAQDLNNSDKQNRFALQEFSDTYGALTTGTGDLSALDGFIGSAETWVSDNAHAPTTGAVDSRVDSKIDTALTTDVVAGDSITVTDNSPSSGQITIGVTNASISTAKLVDSSVTTAKIADGNVTTAKILDANVTTAKILDANVTTAKIADNAVTSAKIADGTIVAGDIAADAVTTAKILDSNVTTGKIADGAVTTAKLADSSVTSAKIVDGTIVAGDLASDSVTTAKIVDSNVTTAKINDSAVTTGKIADSAVTAIKIADGVITSAKLNAATVVTAAEQAACTPDDVTFFTTSASDGRYVNVTGDSMTGALAMGSNKITGLGAPTANADAATKQYVDTSVAAGVGDADYGDITVSGTGTVWTIDSGVVTSAKIADGTIVDGDINAAAAIAGTKISPDFGSQNVTTTGTVTGASLSPTSSTAPTNGVYLPAANTVAISTNGTGRLFVDSSGQVGVGVQSPLFGPLHVREGTNANVIFATEATEAAIQAFNDAGSSETPFRLRASEIKLYTSSTERLRITSAGLVGVGTSSPSNNLHVVGDSDSGRQLRLSGGSSNAMIKAVSPNRTFSFGATTSNFTIYDDDAAVHRLFINSSGNVGIGNTPEHPLDVSGTIRVKGTTDATLFIDSASGSKGFIYWRERTVADRGILGFANGSGDLVYRSGAYDFSSGTERFRCDSSGRLLVGTSSNNTSFGSGIQIAGTAAEATQLISRYVNSSGGPQLYFAKSRSGTVGTNTIVQVDDQLGFIGFYGANGTSYDGGASIAAFVDATPGASSDMPGRLVFSTTADGASSSTERMKLDRNGVITLGLDGVRFCVFRPSGSFAFRGGDVGDGFIRCEDPSANAKFTVSSAGNGVFAGSLSKGSGSFKISHPLLEKTDTHYLVHSFIEGPQADLIYRGHVTLINGTAQVNIDEAGRMTEGTFEALCTNVCCFTSNETDWTPVRGHVDGNILTIEAQDPTSTAEVCWMVIGERKDQHMLDTDWTDENGRVITEPLKEVATPEAQ